MQRIVDLRSDTVTRPTSAMLGAMRAAEVGDDVFGDDPTVRELERRAAAMLGKEAALFVPSGTMANQICIRCHTEPGDEIIVERRSHIYVFEGAGFAALSGVSVAVVHGERGLLDAEGVEAAIRPMDSSSHLPPTRLVCLENTANGGGGTVYPAVTVEDIVRVARANGLRLHLDGARLFNAAVAGRRPVAELARPFDSVCFCLSKGLGCPVGSLIVGEGAFIRRAHRFRKMLGGGMRQAGYLAAAGVHALEHHVDRLAEDHQRAQTLANALRKLTGLGVDPQRVETNMVYINVVEMGRTAEAVATALERRDVRVNVVNPSTLRAVTHIDVEDEGIARAIDAFTGVVEEFTA